MAEGIQIDVNDALWAQKLAAYTILFPQKMSEALHEEFPLLVEAIMKLTPPKTLAQGRAAVGRDIQKVMRSFDPASVRSPGIAKIVAKRDIEAFNLVASKVKSGPMAGARAIPFSPEAHTSQRSRRGRIEGKDRNQVVLGSDAGLLKRYIKSVRDRVGYAKSGWLAALYLVGGRVAPSWVTRHGTTGGAVIDQRGEAMSITAINRTPWAVRKDEAMRIISDAKSSRAVSIENKIKTKLRLARQEAKLQAA